MLETLKQSLRNRSLGKCVAVKTGMVPLSALSSAVVMFDPAEVGSAEAAASLSAFLSSEKINVQLYAIEASNLNFYGKIRKKAPQVPSADAFISLVSRENFTEEYEARRSTARFKAGCRQLEGGVYDLVVATPVWREADPRETVAKMEEILSKIK